MKFTADILFVYIQDEIFWQHKQYNRKTPYTRSVSFIFPFCLERDRVDECTEMLGGGICVHYTILYYTIPYDTMLYYTILYYTILYYTILYYIILTDTISYYTILYLLYYTILCYTILYYTILYYAILYYYTLHCIFIIIMSVLRGCRTCIELQSLS